MINTSLSLEPLVAAHARLLFEKLQDQRLYRYYAGSAPASVAELEQRYSVWEKRASPDGLQVWLNFAVRRDDGEYVGWVQATITDSTALIGYDIFPEYWRRGYGKQACTQLLEILRRKHRVTLAIATVDDENVASIRLLESLGFKLCGTGPSEDLPGRLDKRYEKPLGLQPDF